MVDTKVSDLTAVATPASTDELPVNQAGTSKKLTLGQIRDFSGWYKATVTSDHAISSTSGTEVTLTPTPTLAAGTYIYNFYIIAQSATSTVSPMFGVNFTGTAATRTIKLRYSSTGTTAITGVADDAGVNTGQIEESMATLTFSTSAPNLGATAGVATTGANIMYIIEGILVVTVAGDLELWHGSETATSTTVKAGTSLVVSRVA